MSKVNLQKVYSQEIPQAYSELPSIFSGGGVVINPELSGWGQDGDWITNLAKDYLDDFKALRGLQGRDVDFRYSYVNDYVTIYLDNNFYGILDDEMEEILIFRKEAKTE
ncbi:conserved hypothetical protein [Vibrio chagasii]|nr:hypothetical protein AOG25_09780 [Vibrio alginolyticus]CAH7168948.1 conserved hypothetical protein [Vibrio chagasii]CAH7338513.1 conserved hypothetical protein [Vibrio chagasii]